MNELLVIDSFTCSRAVLHYNACNARIEVCNIGDTDECTATVSMRMRNNRSGIERTYRRKLDLPNNPTDRSYFGAIAYAREYADGWYKETMLAGRNTILELD